MTNDMNSIDPVSQAYAHLVALEYTTASGVSKEALKQIDDGLVDPQDVVDICQNTDNKEHALLQLKELLSVG